MQRSLLTTVQLSALVVLSAAGLFVGDPLSWDMFRFSEPGGWLRSIFLILLMGSLLTTSFGFALKRRRRSDEFAFLAVLACGVNFLVQLKGGLQSPWQGLYLILTGLAAVAFPARLVGLTVGLVFALELSNWLLHQMGTMEDLLRLSGLLLLTVVGFGLMERTERHRIDGVQEELNKLNLGLERLTEPETGEPVSPLSREGKRSGRVEYVRELDKRLGRLLELARLATESQGAFLLQSDESCEILAVQSAAGSVENVSPEPFGVSGGLLAEVVREDRALAISEPARSLPRLPWYRRQPKLHSLLAIPIRGWERRRRVLVFDHLQAGHFNDERQKLAHGAVEQMAEWETWFRRQAKLEQDSKEFQRLHEASARLAEALRVEEILQLIHGFCSEVSHFDTFAVCLVEEGQEEFTVPVAEGYPSGVVGASFPVASHSWAAWMLRGREEPLSFDFPRRRGLPVLSPGEKVPRGASFLGFPLRAKNRVCGALLMTRQRRSFSTEERRVLNILCNQASVAIENARVYERLEQLAATDSLTGLYNRRYFQRALEREVARAERASSSLALLLLDIDHFKKLNDTYGHAMGDLVLKKVARVFQGALRKGDVLARYGGEEFVILLPAISLGSVRDSAERIRTAVSRETIHPGGSRKRVTVSIGWALYPSDTQSPEKLVELADRALYFAKDTGRNRVAGFHVLSAELES